MAFSGGNAFGGAAGGAAIGSAFGPVGAGVGALAGGLLGGFGAFSDDSAQRRLIRKQEELAREAEERRRQQQQASVAGLNQQLLSFGPRNQMMGEMFGPGAAFTSQQVADMGADPMGGPQADYPWIKAAYEQGWDRGSVSDFAQRMGQTGVVDGKREIPDWKKTKGDWDTLQEYARQRREYEERERQRRLQLDANFQPAQGPAPLAPAQAAPAGKY